MMIGYIFVGVPSEISQDNSVVHFVISDLTTGTEGVVVNTIKVNIIINLPFCTPTLNGVYNLLLLYDTLINKIIST